MAKEKKFVEQITAMDVDFAKWYTDVVKKADLVDYSGVKGCMIIRPTAMQYGKMYRSFLMQNSKRRDMRIYTCLCLFPNPCLIRKRHTLKALHPRLLG